MFYVLIFIFELLSSGTHITAKGVTYVLHPAVLMLFRSGIAATVYAIFIIFNFKKIKQIEKKDWWILLILGLLNVPLNQYLFLNAIKMTTAPNASLAYALAPAFVLILAVSFFGEKANLKKISGIVIAFLGTAVILFEKGFDFTSDNFIGFLMVLTASFSYALYTILGREFSIKYGAIFSMGLTMVIGFLLYLPIFFLTGVQIEVSAMSTINWLQVFYLGLITSVIAYGLWYTLLTRTEASKLAVFNNLQPVFTTIFSVFLFGQVLSFPFLTGGILIIAGVYVTQKG